ncbi:hypothetical protein HDV05_003989 [Chytridiales sp. JEL 0842]|nr:hypothetical protein HDV05_003989 [Chytridiales sp. JEL 0842]
MSNPLIGRTIPPITGLHFVKGEPVKVGHPVPEGKKVVTVVEFWATWCGPCRDSIPVLSKTAQRYSTKAVDFIGVTNEKDVSKITAFVNQMGDSMSYPVALDLESSAQREIFAPSGARGIPFAVIIGVEGKVVWAGHPMDPAFEKNLDAQASLASPKTPPKEPEALPPIKDSLEELMTKSVKELKTILKDRGIDFSDCFEKGDLAKRVVERASNITYYK